MASSRVKSHVNRSSMNTNACTMSLCACFEVWDLWIRQRPAQCPFAPVSGCGVPGLGFRVQDQEPREQVVDGHKRLHHVPLRLCWGLGALA